MNSSIISIAYELDTYSLLCYPFSAFDDCTVFNAHQKLLSPNQPFTITYSPHTHRHIGGSDGGCAI